MARRAEPSETERHWLRGLTDVGPTKPVGYLPLYTIEEFVQLTPEAVAAAATARGFATAQFGPAACCIKSGALYVYDCEALANFLQESADAIVAAGLPSDPDRFVAHIATVWFDTNHPAYPLIARASARAVDTCKEPSVVALAGCLQSGSSWRRNNGLTSWRAPTQSSATSGTWSRTTALHGGEPAAHWNIAFERYPYDAVARIRPLFDHIKFSSAAPCTARSAIAHRQCSCRIM